MFRASRRYIPALVLIALAGCQPEVRSEGAAPRIEVAGGASDRDRDTAHLLFADAYAVVHSADFRANLLAFQGTYPKVFARRGDPDWPIEKVASFAGGTGPANRQTAIRVEIVGSDDTKDSTRWTSDTLPPILVPSVAEIRIGKAITDRYRSSDLVQKSCALNTAAHEIAHTISTNRIIFKGAFDDTSGEDGAIPGRAEAYTPVGSYMIGSVAQCTWLQREGRIPRWAIRDCVQVFGARAFNSLRCDRFTGNVPVQLDPTLPPAADRL